MHFGVLMDVMDEKSQIGIFTNRIFISGLYILLLFTYWLLQQFYLGAMLNKVLEKINQEIKSEISETGIFLRNGASIEQSRNSYPALRLFIE